MGSVYSATRRSSDDGYTLVEVMVGMVILSIFLSIFTGVMVSMFHSVNRTTQTSYAQSAVERAFARLDRETRFADGISTPATGAFGVAGSYVVEFSTPVNGTTQCTELWLSPKGTLAQRTWTDGGTISPSQPVALATDILAGTPTVTSGNGITRAGPFSVLTPVDGRVRQRLEIALASRESSQASNTGRLRETDVTFTALNTTVDTVSDSTCTAGRSVSWPGASTS